MSKPLPKLFVVRKYVLAHSASQAIRKEKDQKVDDCWVDEQWKAANMRTTDAIGFIAPNSDD